MKIAVVSDSHDHVWNMRRFVAQANDLGVQVILHCGDLISAFMLEELDWFNGSAVHMVQGNNAGDQFLLSKRLADRKGFMHHHGWLGRMEFSGMTVCWVHDPDIAESLVHSQEFHLVCFGHTHRFYMEKVGKSLLLNPGEILGKKEAPGWALVETEGGHVERVFI